MTAQPGKRGNRFVPALILGYGAWWLLENSGPVLRGNTVEPVPALAAFLLAACGLILLADAFWFSAKVMDWVKARTPTGLRARPEKS